ncbi:MAG: RNA-binding cell elongation regulator Jag/EloR [bacterium]
MAKQDIIIESESVEQAIEKGLKRLGKEKENTDIKILQEASSGLFNQSPQNARVKITAEAVDLPQLMKDVISNILDFMGVEDYTVNVDFDEISYKAMIHSSSHLRFIIGRHGETLNAIQHLVGRIMRRHSDESINVMVDAGNYRQRRHENLRNLAKKSSKRALDNNEEVELEPMVPFERKIIHEAVEDISGVKSHSIGENASRRVVILPRGQT